MGLITGAYVVTTILGFLILWFGIYFLAKWIPPSDDIPVWKAGVMAAAITIFSALFIGLLTGLLASSG